METRSIAGELTIYTAATEKQNLQEALDLCDDLEINLSQVNEMDSAGLQVLIVLKQEAAKRNKKLRYSMHSKAVLDILELSNMTASFGDQIVLT
ncbi:STAS domain-containing protein [Undibacterium cyanobacteriorum]|uniref:STAS domain-containing protein n=1 Tax=Undibacterium cyanobacteriorum TaxID=3073561 RepID=A0ABY9RGN9_9BURK|nr:STAS domain-containing protein [Undibacterium sp. 20NA77.5]WMW80372.1 STAS domain-containing protein [Undibacterium sp. 20NA77.5]